MELRSYIRIIKRALVWIVVVSLLAGGAGLALAAISNVKYDTSLAFTINRTSTRAVEEYQYDGYYAIQAADLYSQTVTSWLATPSVLLEIYKEAKIDPQVESLSSFSSRFTTKKYSSQNIGVRFVERDRATAEAIAEGIIVVIKSKTEAINQAADATALFEIIGSPPVIVQTKPSIITWTILGLIGGFITSLLVVFIVYYLREPGRPNEDSY